MNKNRLKILADWLACKEFYSHGGVVENAIQYAKEDVCQTIASYIDEIMEMDDDQVNYEINGMKNGEKE